MLIRALVILLAIGGTSMADVVTCGEPETDTMTKCEATFFLPEASRWSTAVTFSGPKGPVTIDLKDLSVDMRGNTPPEAARAFWNAVMTVVHKPQLFPETKSGDPGEDRR
jgi:hypothetical protein